MSRKELVHPCIFQTPSLRLFIYSHVQQRCCQSIPGLASSGIRACSGGIGAALTPLISIGLGWLALRGSMTKVTDAGSTLFPHDVVLLLMPIVLILSLLWLSTTEWWFGVCALVWPIWLLALIRERWGRLCVQN